MRGQVTLFIIIALALIMAGVFFFTLEPQQETVGSQAFQQQVQSVEEYVQSCLEAGVEDSVVYLLSHGSINPLEFYEAGSTRIAYFYHETTVDVPTIDDWQEQLKTLVGVSLLGCIDLSFFEEQGLSIEPEPYELVVTVYDETVVFDLSYPLEISMQEEVGHLEDFTYDVSVRLSHLQTTAHNITNAVSLFPFGIPERMIRSFDLNITYLPAGEGQVVYRLQDVNYPLRGEPATLYFATKYTGDRL